MSRLRRPAIWYASWMNFSDDANSELAITNRRKEADELVHNIRDGHFDADTLDELIQVLDHEIFFLETTERTINQQRRNSNALMIPWTSKLVPELSRCLFQTTYPESYYERELQFRALFSTLVLQRAQGTESFEYEHHDALWKQFQKGYQNLQWQKPWAGEFTKERFRKFQCSYMLVSIAEYAKNFKRDEPVVVDLLSRITRLLIAGGSMAMSATAGTGGVGIQSIIQVLNDTFRPLCRVPEERFRDFFVLQEVTRIALAFQLRSQVIKSLKVADSGLDSSDLGLLSLLATSILERILVLLNNDCIEERVSQPTNAWRNFLAIADRGPPCFNDYYHLYGLLDCATQLGRIVDKNDISAPFEERVRKIVKNSKDSSIRWKAIEFLVSTDLCKGDEDTIAPGEIKVIKACLDDEANVLRPPSLSPSRRLSSPPQNEIKSTEWMESEAHFPPFEMTTARDCPRVILPKGLFESNDCYSAGLSPNCGLAYFLREKDILIYSLSDYPKVTERNIILKRTPSIDEDYKDTRAVLTNRFLAVLSRGRSHRLSIYEHGSQKAQGVDIGSEVFDMWYPTCISMFEASNRTWVAIGGHYNRDGRVRLYRIENSHGKLSLKKHDAQFENTQPNALSNDWPKTINFGPDGRRLVCVTKNKNKVLIWFLSDNARPRQAPFAIMKSYEAGITARGIDSASLFYSPSKRPYVFCTTVPSDRRHENGGEWPFISPVHLCPATVPEQLEHAFFGLKKSAPMIAGAVSADGRIAAMLESSGTLILHALRPSENGGICPSGEPVVFKKVLGKHNNALLSNTSIRFHFSKNNKRLCLFAVDIEGRIFRSVFASDGIAYSEASGYDSVKDFHSSTNPMSDKNLHVETIEGELPIRGQIGVPAQSTPSNFKPDNNRSYTSEDLRKAVASHDSELTLLLVNDWFPEVAVGEYAWLKELEKLSYSRNEIADELLERSSHGPWILGESKEPIRYTFQEDLHLSGCLHSKRNSDTRRMIHNKSTGPEASARDDIEYFCGLGGIRPIPSVLADEELQCVSFEDNGTTAIVSLSSCRHTDTSKLLRQILWNLERAAGVLQEEGGSCDSFTFLAINGSHLELQKVDFKILRQFDECISVSSENGHVRGVNFDLFDSLWSQVFPWVKLSDLASDFGGFGEQTKSHACCMVTGFISLAILSYSQAHAGPIRPHFLDTPQQKVIVCNSNSSTAAAQSPCIVGTMVELTCMGEMIGQRVFAFQYLNRFDKDAIRKSSSQKFDLVAYPEDLLDTWGPGELITDAQDPSRLFGISIGGGTITSSRSDESCLHWGRELIPTSILTMKTFNRLSKATIGRRVLQNLQCQADKTKQIVDAIALVEELGTSPSYWEVKERQFGIGVQGGQVGVAALQFNQTWGKMRGITKKSRLLSQQSMYTADLDSEFGVQVSVCTGIARRVKLRHLLADVLPAYISGLITKPRLWTSLHDGFHVIEALRGFELKDWINSLDHEHQQTFESLVVAVLFLLQDTGVDREGQNFVIACIQSEPPFQCFKVPCRRESYWARMLIDSEDIATFAYITTKCLETTQVKCPGPAASWANKSGLLVTAVSCYQERLASSGSSPATTQWSLRHSEAYLIGAPDDSLFVQVDRPDIGEEPRLLVKLSLIPSYHITRIYRRGTAGKPRRLREKKASDHFAESVVILMS